LIGVTDQQSLIRAEKRQILLDVAIAIVGDDHR
jgi:hypothetical protein